MRASVRYSPSQEKSWNNLHSSAFGISIPKDNLSELNTYFNNKYKDEKVEPVHYVDFVFDAVKESKELVACVKAIGDLNKFGLWGQEFEEPTIAITNLNVSSNIQLLSPDKKPTLKIMGEHGLAYMKFFSNMTEFENLQSTGFGFNTLTVVGEASLNEFNGNVTPQILIKEYQKEEKSIIDFF